MSVPIHVTDAEFENSVLKAEKPVVVDFWASWCVPCRTIAPALERMAVEYDGKVIIAKVDVDANPAYAQRYGVQGIPTLLFFQKGKEVNRLVGSMPEARLKEAVAGLIQQAG